MTYVLISFDHKIDQYKGHDHLYDTARKWSEHVYGDLHQIYEMSRDGGLKICSDLNRDWYDVESEYYGLVPEAKLLPHKLVYLQKYSNGVIDIWDTERISHREGYGGIEYHHDIIIFAPDDVLLLALFLKSGVM